MTACAGLQVRTLLLDDHATFFWCVQSVGAGSQDGSTQQRFDVKSGLTGEVHRTLKMTAASDVSRHPRFNDTIDALLGLPPHELLVVPIPDPDRPGRALGVIQVRPRDLCQL